MPDDASKSRELLSSYADAILETQNLIDQNFNAAVKHIVDSPAILVVSGLGKSGLIAKKAAATFSSTGTRAVFVHPVEALHGDLGIVSKKSSLLVLSKSGSNAETIEFAVQFRSVTQGLIISITESDSKLADIADIPLFIPRLAEIDPWNLAPTTSSLTSMAICDVLAVCVQQHKGFSSEDFAQYHPHGALGKRLLLNVSDLMTGGLKLPCLRKNESFSSVIYEISSKGLGLVLLTNEDGSYFGMLTDGDIRRLLTRKEQITNMNAEECFQASRRGKELPTVARGWVNEKMKAIDCLRLMEEEQITSLVILRDEKPIGLVRMPDLVAAGL